MSHSIFSASASERWANCPGSIPMSRGLANTESDAAREGTAGHELGDRCLIDGTDPVQYVGTEVLGIEITDELANAVQEYVDYVRSIPGTRLSEQRVNYAEVLAVPDEEGFGTTDAIVLDQQTVHIIDAKFGRKYVDARNNKQMTLYAAGVVYALQSVGEVVDKVVLHIMQPRVSSTPSPFEMSMKELADAVFELRQAAQLVQEADLLFTSPADVKWTDKYLVAGETQCQWCPAASFCPKLLNGIIEVHHDTSEFDILNTLEEMSAERLAELHSKVPLAELWVKAIEHETFKRLTRGDKIPGLKLVLGREGNRKWADPAAAEAAFQNYPPEKVYEPATLKSPSQIEKTLGKKLKPIVDSLCVRNPARPTITVDTDPRQLWVDTPSLEGFENEDEAMV